MGHFKNIFKLTDKYYKPPLYTGILISPKETFLLRLRAMSTYKLTRAGVPNLLALLSPLKSIPSPH